jgi:hypothetical protein
VNGGEYLGHALSDSHSRFRRRIYGGSSGARSRRIAACKLAPRNCGSGLSYRDDNLLVFRTAFSLMNRRNFLRSLIAAVAMAPMVARLRSYDSGLSLGRKDAFRFIAMGSPESKNDPLGVSCEPNNGWVSVHKTPDGMTTFISKQTILW